MTCDVCSALNDITPDNKYIRSLILHTKLVHRQAQSKSSDCESCKEIEEIIEDDRHMLGKIGSSTQGLRFCSVKNLMLIMTITKSL